MAELTTMRTVISVYFYAMSRRGKSGGFVSIHSWKQKVSIVLFMAMGSAVFAYYAKSPWMLLPIAACFPLMFLHHERVDFNVIKQWRLKHVVPALYPPEGRSHLCIKMRNGRFLHLFASYGSFRDVHNALWLLASKSDCPETTGKPTYDAKPTVTIPETKP